MIRLPALASALALASCVQPKAPPPAAPAPKPAPLPAPAPPPPAATDWRDAPRTPGTWTFRAETGGVVAMFGQAGKDPLFAVGCIGMTRQVSLARIAGLPPGESARMTIRTTTATKTYPATARGTTPPTIVVTLPATDRFLDAMMYSRGRFIVSVNGAADLVIPPWPEMHRTVEECRG